MEIQELARRAALFAAPGAVTAGVVAAGAAAPIQADSAKIGIDDFLKGEMRVGLVLAAGRLKGSDKLRHLKVEIGEPEPRTLVAGIAEANAPHLPISRKLAL